MAKRVFTDVAVLDAARERVARVFDLHERVVVSVSGGKDSTALFHLAVQEAERRGRRIAAFFLDQEAEYASTIDVIEEMMKHPLVDPLWYQVPIRMTNAVSYEDIFLNAWQPGEEWMREKHPLAIHAIDGKAPDRFYDFFPWLEERLPGTGWLIGLRAEESLNRYRSVVKNPGRPGIPWSTKTGCPDSFRYYPIYDWGMGDVWRFIRDEGVFYNSVYDKMLAAGHGIFNTMRVSNLVHEKAFKALASLQEFEPDTFDRLVLRLKGVHVASIYALEDQVFSVRKLPAQFASWRDYRDYLLETSPISKRERLKKRMRGQGDDEAVCRHHCRQILLNDWEGNLGSISEKKIKERREEVVAKWREIL